MLELELMLASKVLNCAILGSLALAVSSFAQAGKTSNVGGILDNTAAQSKTYVEEFKNLIADEKKTFEIFDKKGEVKKRRTVESTFLVYPLSKAEGEVAEFRNIIAVDGKK